METPFDYLEAKINGVSLSEAYKMGFQAGKQEQSRVLYAEVICPMCYRLNPQHATADYGVGCKSCHDKEKDCGKTN